jgi:hypothetical protein
MWEYVGLVCTAASSVRSMEHKRESQDDVAHFSTWPGLGLALMYAEEEPVIST